MTGGFPAISELIPHSDAMLLLDRVLEHATTQRAVALIPVALLGALVAVQVLADGQRLTVDARLAGLGVAAVLLALRVPFLPMVVAAALTAALLRAAG